MRNFDTYAEYQPEYEAFEAEQFEWGHEAEWGHEGEVFSEAEVLELAGELLEVTNEAELDRFIGALIGRAASGLGKVVRSPVGQAVGGFLKGAAKKALPLAGQALGGAIGGRFGASSLGSQIGGGLASALGDAIGLEAEAFQSEDREFEGAKSLVRLAGDAVKTAVNSSPSANPAAVAQSAVTAAAQKYAPGLLGGTPASPNLGRGGRWIRQGRNIVIVNCQ